MKTTMLLQFAEFLSIATEGESSYSVYLKIQQRLFNMGVADRFGRTPGLSAALLHRLRAWGNQDIC